MLRINTQMNYLAIIPASVAQELLCYTWKLVQLSLSCF
jgi:hypothetical protein